MRIAIDYDGVLTANRSHYEQLIRDFLKSGHSVFILTGANWERYDSIYEDINRLGLDIEIIGRKKDFVSTPKNIGKWKKRMLLEYDIDLWFDNDVKTYEQQGINFGKLAIVRV